MINGGLEIVLLNFVQEIFPVPIEMVGVNDTFGESGKPHELLTKYGLDAKILLVQLKELFQENN